MFSAVVEQELNEPSLKGEKDSSRRSSSAAAAPDEKALREEEQRTRERKYVCACILFEERVCLVVRLHPPPVSHISCS